MITKKSKLRTNIFRKTFADCFLICSAISLFPTKVQSPAISDCVDQKNASSLCDLKKITVYTVYFESNNSGIKVHHFCSSSRFNDDSTFLLQRVSCIRSFACNCFRRQQQRGGLLECYYCLLPQRPQKKALKKRLSLHWALNYFLRNSLI